MITEERLTYYLRSLEKPKSPLLESIRKEALETGVPIVRPETEALLSFFVEAFRPKEILEVGTAVGYSALLMAESLPEDGHITTIENYPPRIEKASENIEKAGETGRITLLPGDASEILSKLLSEQEAGKRAPFDLVFMDAAKAQYIVWLPVIRKLLRPGGILLSDNVLQDGDVAESRYAVRRRDRTIHTRMREYLYTLKHAAGLTTAVLPLGDGVAVTLVREKESDSVEQILQENL